MAKPTEERVHQDFVAEKCLPLGIIEIRSNNRRLAAVPFLHQFEKDVSVLDLPTGIQPESDLHPRRADGPGLSGVDRPHARPNRSPHRQNDLGLSPPSSLSPSARQRAYAS